MKICVACSAGGHLAEAMQLRSVFDRYPHFFVTFRRQDTVELSRKNRVYFVANSERNPLKFLYNCFQSLRIALRERPDVVISTGAGEAVSFCIFAKLLGSKVVYVESVAAVQKPSLCGRVMYHFNDLFFVQWKSLMKFYPKAIYGGSLI